MFIGDFHLCVPNNCIEIHFKPFVIQLDVSENMNKKQRSRIAFYRQQKSEEKKHQQQKKHDSLDLNEPTPTGSLEMKSICSRTPAVI